MRALLAAALLVPALAAAQPCPSPSFALPVDLGLPVEALSQLRSADVDGDGRRDLLAFLLSGRVVVFWSRSAGLVPGPTTELAGDPRSALALDVADLNGDGRADLLVVPNTSGPSSRRFESWIGDGAGSFARAATVPLDAGVAGGLSLVHFDGAPVLDVFSAARSASDASKLVVLRWRGRGDGTFQAPAALLTLDDPFPGTDAGHGVVAGDVDGDGRTDLVVSSVWVWTGFSFASSLWLGNGAGDFSPSVPAPSGRATRLIDLDGDGKDEVVYDTMRKLRYVGLARRLADGTWRDIASWMSDHGILVGELDRDSAHEEVLVSEDQLRAYRLGDASSTSFATIPAKAPATLLDLDGDVHLDVVALAPGPINSPGRLVVARSICGPGAGSTKLFLPAILSLTGAEATRFETEVVVTNFGTSAVSAALRLQSGGGAPRAVLASFTLAAGQVRILSTAEDATAERLTLPVGIDHGTATLEVSTSDGTPPNVVADTRVLTQRPGSGRGGVGLSARPSEKQQIGSSGEIAWLEEDPGDRTNLAVASAGEDPVTLRVTVFSSDPERPGRVVLPDVTLPPFASHQWNRVLSSSGLGARTGWARIERLAGGPWTAWATVNSNGTGDGSVVEAAATGSVALLPAIVGTDRYRSDVVLTNTTAVSRTVTLRLSPVSGDGSLALDIEVGAESSRRIDPVSALREALVLPPGPYVGHATLSAGVLAGARVKAASSDPSASFGVYTPPADFTYEGAVLVSGLRQDEKNRSNLALVVRSVESPSRFRVELYDGRSGTLAKTIEDVSPGTASGAPSRIQLDSILLHTGIPFGWARIVKTAGWSPFFAYAVVNDGEGPGLGSGDGTYLPGIPR